MAIPFALPLQSQITDENKLAASENVPDSLGDIALAGDNIEFKPEIEPNYSVVGTPIIEDNIASGFNSSSCLTTENPFIAEECTGIEIVLVFEVPAVAGVPLIANAIPGVAPYFRVLIGSSGSLAIKYTDTIGEDKTASARAFITADTKNWYKAVYDASAGTWTHYNSTDEGVNWTLLNRVSDYSNAPSLETGDLLYWGKNGENQGVTYFNGKIYLEDCYIKTTSISGEKTLKFFKETGKTTVSATVPEVDLTGYLKNLATGTNSFSVNTALTADSATSYGVNTTANGTGATSIGYNAKSTIGTVAVGINSEATVRGAVAIGPSAKAKGSRSIQIGYGTNSEDNSVYMSTSQTENWKLLGSDGKIPAARLPDVSYKSLDETQKTQLLLNGTYDASEVVDGEVFTEYDGKFVEFDKTPRAFDNLQQLTQQANDRGTYFKGKYIYGVSGNRTGYQYIHVSEDEGNTWNAYTSPVTVSSSSNTIRFLNLEDKLILVRGNSSDGSDYSFYVSDTGYDNWIEITTLPEHYIDQKNVCKFKDKYYMMSDYDFLESSDATTWEVRSDFFGQESVSYTNLFTDGEYLYMGDSSLYRYNGETVEGPLTTPGTYTRFIHDTYFTFSLHNSPDYYFAKSIEGPWTDATAPVAYALYSLAYTDGTYLTINYSSETSNIFASTQDCLNWTQNAMPSGISSYATLTVGNGTFLISRSNRSSLYYLYKGTTEISYEYSLNPLSYTKEEVDAAIASVDLTGYLQNTATGTSSLTINSSNPSSYTASINIGSGSSATGHNGIAIGVRSIAFRDSLAIGSRSNDAGSTATGESSIAIGNSSYSGVNFSVAIGASSTAGYQTGGYTTSVGAIARAYGLGSTAIGANSTIGSGSSAINYATAIGYQASANGTYATSLGYNAKATAASAIQIGNGTNATANTMNVALSDSLNVQLLDANGKIPGERMSLQGITAPDTTTVGSIGQFYVDTTTSTGYMCVGVDTTTPSYTWKQITYSPVGTEYILEAGNWNTENNSIEISIPGLTIGTPMWIAPTVSEDNSNELNYTTHGIRLKAQQADSIILSCTIIPTENISITIIR